jgi:hypothetical protein
MATTPANPAIFRGLTVIIGSAVAASAMTYGLFDNFLTGLVPPIVDAHQSVQFGSLGTAIVLLALSLIVQRKLSSAKAKTIGYASLVAVVVAGFLFVHFKSYSRDYVYRYPPLSQPDLSQKLHVSGKLHDKGQSYVGNKTVAQAVFELGGPDMVDGNGVLWTAAAKRQVITWLEALYLLLSGLLTSTLFLAGLAVWRYKNSQPPSTPGVPPRKSKAKAKVPAASTDDVPAGATPP